MGQRRGVTRRDFVKIGVAGVTAAALAGCKFPQPWVQLAPYVHPPEEQLVGVATWYASACRQCPAGCGIIVRIMNGRALKLEGNPEHPLNQGKLCARGQAGLQILYNPDRLPGPVRQAVRGSKQFQPIAWDEALNLLAARLSDAGSNIAVWGGSTMSGHLYDLFLRFTGALGAPAPLILDLYSILQGYTVLRSASQTLFGQDHLPVYDLSHTDVVLSFGADFLGTWLSAVRYGIEYGNMRGQPLGKRGYLVQLEPRMSITGAKADKWLSIRPGQEGPVAQALARLIADQSLGSPERVARARALAADIDVQSVATASGISVDELLQLARLFAQAAHPLAIPGGTVSGQNNAVEATVAVQALNAIAGTLGEPGSMSLAAGTPQPNLLIPVPSSLTDLEDFISRVNAGQVQVLLISGANPAYSLSNQIGGNELLSKIPFIVSFNSIVDETAVQADLVLTDRTYLEDWGYAVVSPSFGLPVVSSQQPVVTPVVDNQSTANILLTVAKHLPATANALPWPDEVMFLQEVIATLPPGAQDGSGADVLWARFLQHGGWWPSAAPAAPPVQVSLSKLPPVSAANLEGNEAQYPYVLYIYTSILLSDGRGASQLWLQGTPDPMTTASWQTWVELHPTTAQKLHVAEGDIVRVISPYGQLEAPVFTYPAIQPDTVAIPTGQGHTADGRYAQDRGANPMQLIGTRPGQTGDNLDWFTVRVNLVPTGRLTSMSIMENKLGVTKGFINKSFPGQGG